MNGRAYDYNLGRFLSVDPFIQDPGNSQSMNPYSYIMNNPLAGTDPSGYLGCAASRVKSKCESLPLSEGGSGKALGGKSKILDNGKDVTHGVGLTGSAENVEEIGSVLKEEGYSLSTASSNSNGTVTKVYTKTYSGGTQSISESISGVASMVDKISLGAESIGLATGVMSNYKIVPQFSPAGGVFSWQVLAKDTIHAGMRLNFSGFASVLGKVGNGLGLTAPIISFAGNLANPNFSNLDVAGKLGLDITIAGIAMKIGGWPGVLIGGGYMGLDHHVNSTYGGWMNGLNAYSSFHGTMMEIPSILGAHAIGLGKFTISEYNRMISNGVHNIRRNIEHYSENPEQLPYDMLSVPNIKMEGL